MADIDIKDFGTVTGVNAEDSLLLSLKDGTAGKVKWSLIMALIKAGVSPKIKDGTWWIGDLDTGVTAQSETVILRKGANGIEWSYNGSDRWTLVATWKDLRPLDVMSDADFKVLEKSGGVIEGVIYGTY